MYLVLLFAATALLGSGKSANVNKYMKLLSEIDDTVETNELSFSPMNAGNLSPPPALFGRLTLVNRPLPAYTHAAGTVLELSCDAAGAPAPSIHWFKNDAPVYEFEAESNELIDSNPSSFARVISTLLVTRTTGSDVYTCRVTAGVSSASASTFVYSKDGSTSIPERTKLFPLEPRIVVSYKTYMDVMGNNVVLPCKVKGHPKPHVMWMGKGVIIKKDPRMKVLRSGELVISALRWSDMGEYTCVASNAFGSTQASTFLYPVKSED